MPRSFGKMFVVFKKLFTAYTSFIINTNKIKLLDAPGLKLFYFVYICNDFINVSL